MKKNVNLENLNSFYSEYNFTDEQKAVMDKYVGLMNKIGLTLSYFNDGDMVAWIISESIHAISDKDNFASRITELIQTDKFINLLKASIEEKILKEKASIDSVNQVRVYDDFDDFCDENSENFNRAIDLIDKKLNEKFLICPFTNIRCTSSHEKTYLDIEKNRLKGQKNKILQTKSQSLRESWKKYMKNSADYCKNYNFDGKLSELLKKQVEDFEKSILNLEELLQKIEE